MKNLARCDFSAMLGSARLFLMMGPKVMVYGVCKTVRRQSSFAVKTGHFASQTTSGGTGTPGKIRGSLVPREGVHFGREK